MFSGTIFDLLSICLSFSICFGSVAVLNNHILHTLSLTQLFCWWLRLDVMTYLESISLNLQTDDIPLFCLYGVYNSPRNSSVFSPSSSKRCSIFIRSVKKRWVAICFRRNVFLPVFGPVNPLFQLDFIEAVMECLGLYVM